MTGAPAQTSAWDNWPGAQTAPWAAASAQAQRSVSAPGGLSSMTKATGKPVVIMTSTEFTALAEEESRSEARPPPTILEAIRWRSSTTQRSRRDILRQKLCLMFIRKYHQQSDLFECSVLRNYATTTRLYLKTRFLFLRHARRTHVIGILENTGKICSLDSSADMCNCIHSRKIGKSDDSVVCCAMS